MASKKRRNISSEEDGHFSKGIRTDADRRGLAADTGGADSSSGPSLITRTNSNSTKRATSARSSGGRQERLRHFACEMAELNYQTYAWAKEQLAKGSLPTDAFFAGVCDNYVRESDGSIRRFNRQYGDVIVMGSGDCGQLGCGESITEARRPKVVANMRGMDINMVASGGLHSLALDNCGRVYSFGCNDEGSLGWHETEEMDDGALPSEVKGFYPSQFGPNGKTESMVDGNGHLLHFEERKEAVITQIAAGETQSVALSSEGDVYMWGTLKDNEGRKFRHMPPGDDTRTRTGFKDMDSLEDDEDPVYYQPPRGNQDWPSHVVQMPMKAKDISAGASFIAALLEDDTIVTWGIGITGELARPVPELNKKTSNKVVLEDYLKPKPVIWEQPTLKRTVLSLSCGGMHILVLSREDGGLGVYSSGLNQYGQLGHSDQKIREVLTKIQFFEGKDITKVEAGYHFSCFVDKSGKELYTCGRGDYGQLGITLKQPDPGYFESTPCRIPLVYEPTGTVEDPKVNSIKTENIVEADQPEIEQISCGSTHALVVTKEGDAYSWGFGTSGACGQGDDDDDVLLPKKLVLKAKKGSKRMNYVSGGGQHSTAIITSGDIAS